MQTLYNSENFVVVRFDMPADAPQGHPQARGGYEIVDKFARREIFIEGAVAESFKKGVQALAQSNPTEEAMDEFIGSYCTLAQQPVALH